MAPLHHHFELLGWSETQVVVRFWIVGILLLLLGMSARSSCSRRAIDGAAGTCGGGNAAGCSGWRAAAAPPARCCAATARACIGFDDAPARDAARRAGRATGPGRARRRGASTRCTPTAPGTGARARRLDRRRAQPGRAARRTRAWPALRGRRAGPRRAGAGPRASAARRLVGHHRHQRQVDHHRTGSPTWLRAAGLARARRWATWGGRCAWWPTTLAPDDVRRARVQQLPARDDRDVPARAWALVLNLAPDHLDRYPDLASYYAAKQRLAEATAGRRPVRHLDRAAPRPWPGRTAGRAAAVRRRGRRRRRLVPRRRQLWAATGTGAARRCWRDGRAGAALAAQPAQRAATVAAVVPWAWTCRARPWPRACARSRGLAAPARAGGRACGGVRFVNDTKATNVARGVRRPGAATTDAVVLIAGGSGKGEDYAPLREVMGPVRARGDDRRARARRSRARWPALVPLTHGRRPWTEAVALAAAPGRAARRPCC